ncbi:MAG: hypothetical protein IKR86_05110 [Candidatus Methanomethylophilaceae archaeon]|nr:hypothetical protein [Candidatus Methanomethylophilaceae archaeon]
MSGKHSIFLGLVFAAVAAMLYIGVPYGLKFLLDNPSTMGWDLSSFQFQGVRAMLDRAMQFGAVMAVLYFFVGFFRKGDKMRIAAQTAAMIGNYIWFLYLVNFGDLKDFAGFRINDTEVTVGVAVTWLIGVMALLNLLKIPIFYGQYRDNREEFLEKYDPDGFERYKISHYSDEDYEADKREKRRRRRWGSTSERSTRRPRGPDATGSGAGSSGLTRPTPPDWRTSSRGTSSSPWTRPGRPSATGTRSPTGTPWTRTPSTST